MYHLFLDIRKKEICQVIGKESVCVYIYIFEITIAFGRYVFRQRVKGTEIYPEEQGNPLGCNIRMIKG